MVIDRPPAAVRLCRDTDIVCARRRGEIAGRAGAGFIDKPGLRADNRAAGILILNPAQEPVGQQNAVRIALIRDLALERAGRQHLCTELIAHGRLQDHRDIRDRALVLLARNAHRIVEMGCVRDSKLLSLLIHQFSKILNAPGGVIGKRTGRIRPRRKNRAVEHLLDRDRGTQLKSCHGAAGLIGIIRDLLRHREGIVQRLLGFQMLHRDKKGQNLRHRCRADHISLAPACDDFPGVRIDQHRVGAVDIGRVGGLAVVHHRNRDRVRGFLKHQRFSCRSGLSCRSVVRFLRACSIGGCRQLLLHGDLRGSLRGGRSVRLCAGIFPGRLFRRKGQKSAGSRGWPDDEKRPCHCRDRRRRNPGADPHLPLSSASCLRAPLFSGIPGHFLPLLPDRVYPQLFQIIIKIKIVHCYTVSYPGHRCQGEIDILVHCPAGSLSAQPVSRDNGCPPQSPNPFGFLHCQFQASRHISSMFFSAFQPSTRSALDGSE